MKASEILGRSLACLVFVSLLVLWVTVPQAHTEARMFWWAILSGVTALAGLGGLLLMLSRNHHL